MITLLERRASAAAGGSVAAWDRHAEVPAILKDGGEYDPNLTRFLSDLPLNGVRSHHSPRSYGYDIVVWLRFLEARGKSLWQANRDDVDAYHRARRRDDATHRISAASWKSWECSQVRYPESPTRLAPMRLAATRWAM
jgi:hypothetical protein